MRHPLLTSAVAATVVMVIQLASAQSFWVGVNGVSLSTNWSDTANWSTALSPAGTDVVFSTNSVVALGTINNVVDANVSIASLNYANTNLSHTTLVAPGVTLDITGSSGPNGAALFGGAPNTTDVPAFTNRITGVGGTLTINNSGANIIVRQGPNGSSGGNRTTLDLSGLDTFTAAVGRVLLSGNSPAAQNRSTGRLILARTNTITASGSSPALIVGESTSNNGGGSSLLLGQTNALYVNNIAVGRTKESGSAIRFNGGLVNPVAFIRAADGTSPVATWTMGDGASDSGTTTCNGTTDFTGGTVDALVGTMQVGRSSSGGSGANLSTGTFTFNAGTVEVATLQIGLQGGSNAKGASGTVNVNGGLLNVTTALELGRTLGGTGYYITVARLNINGGTVRTPAITASYGANLSTNNTITMNNGTLVVTNTAGPGIATFTMTNATLTVPVSIAGPAVIVTNLTLGGSTNVINISSIPVVSAYPAQFPVVKYTGAIGGVPFNVGRGTLPPSTPAYAGYIANNAANSSIDFVLTGGPVPARAITWSGATDANWDTTTPNWAFSGPTTYNQNDFVRFDDTASRFVVSLAVSPLTPSSVIVSNVSQNYNFSGPGVLSGTTGITKEGAGTLTVANDTANDFTGPIVINGGTLSYNQASGVAIANVISGAGTFNHAGSGTPDT